MTNVICDYDFCNNNENGKCRLGSIKIHGGCCQEIKIEEDGENND